MAEETILEFCRPVFDKVVHYGLKAGAESTPLDAEKCRAEIISILDRMRLESRGVPQLGQQLILVELPILFFVDFMMQSGITSPGTWSELAFERNELAGDEKFFDLLEQTLGNPTEMATERIAVFYQCMALGFTGTYSDDSQDLHRLFRRCALRLGLSPEIVEIGQLTPEAYEQLDLKTRHTPLNSKRWRNALIACLVGFAVVHIVNQFVFRSAVIPSREELGKVADQTRQNFTPRKSALSNANFSQPSSQLAPDPRTGATGSGFESEGSDDSSRDQPSATSGGEGQPVPAGTDSKQGDSGKTTPGESAEGQSSSVPGPSGSKGDDS